MSEQNCSCPDCTSADAGTLAAAFAVLVADAPDELPPESEPPQPAAASAAVVRTTAGPTNRRCRGARRPSLVSDIPASSCRHRAGTRRPSPTRFGKVKRPLYGRHLLLLRNMFWQPTSAATLPPD